MKLLIFILITLVTYCISATCIGYSQEIENKQFIVIFEKNKKVWIFHVPPLNTINDTILFRLEEYKSGYTDTLVMLKKIRQQLEKEKISSTQLKNEVLELLHADKDCYDTDSSPAITVNREGTYAFTHTRINQKYDWNLLINLVKLKGYSIVDYRFDSYIFWSNDGNYFGGSAFSNPVDSSSIAVIDARNRKIIFTKTINYPLVRKIAWDSSSSRIAVLYESSNNKWYHTLITLLSGHGARGTLNYHLVIFDISGNILFSKTLLTDQAHDIKYELLWSE